MTKKILVAEDSKDIRQLLGEILSDEGYQVFYAENGLEAIERVLEVTPHLILMDLSLPELNGWEVVENLRSKPTFQATPIIAVTAHASAADRSRALAIGCTSYLSKPFDIEALLKLVAELIK